MKLTRVVTISLALILLAGGCYWLAENYVMRGLQNCTGLYTLPIPKNCAGRQAIMMQQFFGITCVALLLLAAFLPFFAVYRHNKFSQDEMNSIKITE